MQEEEGNARRLREAGLIADRPLPDRYYEMISQLSDEEVDVLLSLKRRLDDAGIATAPLSAYGEEFGRSIVIL